MLMGNLYSLCLLFIQNLFKFPIIKIIVIQVHQKNSILTYVNIFKQVKLIIDYTLSGSCFHDCSQLELTRWLVLYLFIII